jgi:hypothetical protein
MFTGTNNTNEIRRLLFVLYNVRQTVQVLGEPTALSLLSKDYDPLIKDSSTLSSVAGLLNVAKFKDLGMIETHQMTLMMQLGTD